MNLKMTFQVSSPLFSSSPFPAKPFRLLSRILSLFFLVVSFSSFAKALKFSLCLLSFPFLLRSTRSIVLSPSLGSHLFLFFQSVALSNIHSFIQSFIQSFLLYSSKPKVSLSKAILRFFSFFQPYFVIIPCIVSQLFLFVLRMFSFRSSSLYRSAIPLQFF